MNRDLKPQEKLFYRDQLREARAKALADAEGYQAILYCIERLGATILREVKSLGYYRNQLCSMVEDSPLASENAKMHKYWHTNFSSLFDILIESRNSALHQGARARHITMHAIQVALILEDALMSKANYVKQFMVRNVIQAFPWQPISFIRLQMLEHSISYIPIYINSKWYLISEASLAKYLRQSGYSRKSLLVKQISEAKELALDQAVCVYPNDKLSEVVNKFCNHPLLVVDESDKTRLLGILTAADAL